VTRGLNVWRRRSLPEIAPATPEPESYGISYTQDKLFLTGAIRDQAELEEVIFALTALREFLPSAIRQDNPNET
jgi:hypothetical protein